ncbi:MAG: MFS transporter [Thermoplasmatota archaeon]
MLSGLSGGAYVRLLSAVYMATLIIRVAFGVVVVTFAKAVPGSNTVYGLIISSSPLLELCTIVFVGPIVDRHGGKRVLLFGLLLGAISLTGLSTTTNPYILGLFNGMHGIAAASILVPTLAIIAEVAPESVRGREMGTFNFVNMFGYVLGFGIGFFMLDFFRGDLQITFLIAGLLALLGFIYAFFNIRGSWRGVRSDDHVSLKTFQVVLARREILLLAVPWFIIFVFVAALISFQGRALGGFPGVLVGLAIVFGGLAFVVTQFVYGKLSDQYGRDPFILVGAVGFLGVTLLALGGALAGGAGGAQASLLSLWPLFAIAVLAGMAFPPAGLAAMVDAAEDLPKGVVMSVYTLTLSLGFVVSPFLTGVIADHWGVVGVMSYFVILGIIFLALLLYRHIWRPKTARPPAPPGVVRV